MGFSKKLSKEISVLLEEIKDTFALQPSGTTWFTFNTFPDDDKIDDDYYKGVYSAKHREKILLKLKELGALDLKPKKVDTKKPDFVYTLKLNKKALEKLEKDLSKHIDIDTDQPVGVFLHLDNDGNFWREPKEKFCYPMGARSDRFKIIKYLAENSGYQAPEMLSAYLDGKDKQAIRSEIGKIRVKIKNFLQIDGGEILQGKKGSGYRINPAYKILHSKQ